MRLLVCGGREYNNKKLVYEILEKFNGVDESVNIEVVIHGGAKGADSLAGIVAETLFLEVLVYPADWTKHGKSAGPIRNAQMLKEGKPDLVLAFPGGKGTENMILQAVKAGVPVLLVKDEGEL
jgi:predicted polyphosphate/ATP-dependent NAD kinase